MKKVLSILLITFTATACQTPVHSELEFPELEKLSTTQDVIQYQIDESPPSDWTISPQINPDTLSVECREDLPTHVSFISDLGRKDFQLAGNENVLFDVVTQDGQRAVTQIACIPERLRFRGDYADSPLDNRNFKTDINNGTLDEHIREMMRVRKIPGVSVIVVQDGDSIFQKSYGVTDTKTKTSINSRTPLRMASATKVLSSLVFLAAAERGDINLDARVGDYLKDAPSDWKKVPLWRLLNHTSGLPTLGATNIKDMTEPEKSDLTPLKIYNHLKQQPLDFQPGERIRYQQGTYAILALILERETNRNWGQAIEYYLFKPAGMVGTVYGDSLSTGPKAYTYENAMPAQESYYYPKGVSMGGGYNITPHDMAALFKAWNKGALVSERFYAEQVFDQKRLPDGNGYSLATIVETIGTTRTVGHEGGAGAANIRYAPDQKIGVAVFTNLNANNAAQDISAEILELLFDHP